MRDNNTNINFGLSAKFIIQIFKDDLIVKTLLPSIYLTTLRQPAGLLDARSGIKNKVL